MIEINLLNVNAGVLDVNTPDGPIRVLRMEDPQAAIAVVMPMDLLTATRMGNALLGNTLVVPTPPVPPGPGGVQ